VRTVLTGALALNAALGLGYRIYRLAKGGPMSDVAGGALLGALLGITAAGVAMEAGWARWAAVVYGLLFGVAVMPVWILAVFIPLRPGPADYAFTAVYWAGLAVIVVSALSL
jgi:hypothetical protein